MCWYVLGYHDIVFAGEIVGCDGVEWSGVVLEWSIEVAVPLIH